MDTDLNKVDVWFQDETRVGQQGSITRMWAPKGTRPSAVRQQHKNMLIFLVPLVQHKIKHLVWCCHLPTLKA